VQNKETITCVATFMVYVNGAKGEFTEHKLIIIILERKEMRMLRWILGVSLKDRKQMKIFDKQLESLVSQTRYGKQDCDSMGTCSEEKMIALTRRSRKLNCYRSRGRQKKRWSDMVQQDLVTLHLNTEDAADTDKWLTPPQ